MIKYIFSLIMAIASLILAIGVKTFASACPAMPNGRFMMCHWAGEVVFGLGVLLLILSIIHFISKKTEMKQGISIAIFLNSIFTMLVPGNIVHLCMKTTMRCHMVMKPFVMVVAGIIAVVAIVDFFMRRKCLKKENCK